MSEEPAVPEFTLPDWGEDGAPPEPASPDEQPEDLPAGPEFEIRVEAPVILSTTALPPRWAVQTVHGLVTGHGVSEKDRFRDAVESATEKATRSLGRSAGDLGANAVTGLQLTTTSRKGQVVVTAYGTAVTFSR